ncbi:WD repeat-containing protein 55-like isoform X2 [Liolophura sinensis]
MRDKPKEINFESMVVDVCFHPMKDVLAAGGIDGYVTIHSYSTSDNNRTLMTLPHHKKACRCVRFSPDGGKLFTASKDRSIKTLDLNACSTERNFTKAHESAIYSMLIMDENFFATGDDDGTLKIWDLRQANAVMTMRENEEFISDMVVDKDRKILAVTSGDGTLTAFNVRRRRMELQSELFDSEMLSITKVKDDSKVVCGTGDGILNIFNWGEWGNISDRFPGHPMSVDCLVTVGRDLICSGSMDGVIRAVNIVPNRFVGVVGKHEEFPIEGLSVSRDNKLLASCSHDNTIKFWNIENLGKEKFDSSKKPKKASKTKLLGSEAKSDFFADLAGEEAKAADKQDVGGQDNEDSGSDSSDDEDDDDEDSGGDDDDGDDGDDDK